jgi:2-oxoglutarate ferredoxin oxidoreductase subunit alpha
MAVEELNVVIGGEAGQGLVTVGALLAKAAVRAGYEVCVTQSYQSRIRGGHNTFALRVANRVVEAPAERVDVLVALNAETVALHRPELNAGGLVLADARDGVGGDDVISVPYADLSAERYANVAAAGVVGALAEWPEDVLAGVIADEFAAHPADLGPNRDALAAAYKWAAALPAGTHRPLPAAANRGPRLVLDGNEALALGAVSAGLKFFSYYPMTPSTGVGLTLVKHARAMGLVVEQAEDELAAINMACGASFAGAPSMVATSGGGFALMVEAVALAAMTETPVVIVVGQRPGPATGLPTRTEQAELNFVLHAGHGEFPRAVFAPADPEECFHLARRALETAQRYQTPVFILTDQFIADSIRGVEPFEVAALLPTGAYLPPASFSRPYRRYEDAPDGVSPRLLPGFGPELVVADSDEHTADGHLTEDLDVRRFMVEKRLRKMKGMREGVTPPRYEGPLAADLLVVCWGSTLGAVREACATLNAGGGRAALLHFSQVWPLRGEDFRSRLEGAKRVVAVEGNATHQFAGLIRRETGFAVEEFIGRYDGLPITPGYILRGLEGKGDGRDG